MAKDIEGDISYIEHFAETIRKVRTYEEFISNEDLLHELEYRTTKFIFIVMGYLYDSLDDGSNPSLDEEDTKKARDFWESTSYKKSVLSLFEDITYTLDNIYQHLEKDVLSPCEKEKLNNIQSISDNCLVFTFALKEDDEEEEEW